MPSDFAQSILERYEATYELRTYVRDGKGRFAGGTGTHAGIKDASGGISFDGFMSASNKGAYIQGAFGKMAEGLGLKTKVQVISDADFNAKVSKAAKQMGVNPNSVKAVYVGGNTDEITFRERSVKEITDKNSFRLFSQTASHELGHAYDTANRGVSKEKITSTKQYDNSSREAFADTFGSRLGLVIKVVNTPDAFGIPKSLKGEDVDYADYLYESYSVAGQ